IMIVLLAVLFRLFLRQRLIDRAKDQAEKGLAGSMEGHAAMDMTVHEEGGLWQRLRSKHAITSVSHIFVMEWAAVIREIIIGLLIAGAIAAWVPDGFWHHFFAVDHPLLSKLWGPVVGPIVSLLSFVCSIGNVPLAGVLWNNGISFGGVIAFIFADLIILPILVIYRKYYGTKMMLFILGSFYVTMVVAGFLVELLFNGLGLVPTLRNARVGEIAIHWDYTTYLNVAALILAAGLISRFVSTGGVPMLKMMGGSPEHEHEEE
ncbi:MAG: permease, partial [Acidimicrobiales bacterium]